MQHSYPRLYGRRPPGARGDADKGARSRDRLSKRLAASGDGSQSYNTAGADLCIEYMLCDLDKTGTEDRAIRDPGTDPFKCKRATDMCNILAGWLKAQSLTGLRHLGLESVGGRTAFIAGRAKEQVLYPRFPSD